MPGANFHSYTLREPVGVVGQIIPWNFPLLMAAWKLGPALTTGNRRAQAGRADAADGAAAGRAHRRGRHPTAWSTWSPASARPGAALAAHDDVDKVAFTGSTEVGKLIVQAAAGNLKKVTLELGGKSPNIVFDDAEPTRSRAPPTRSSSTTASAASPAPACSSRRTGSTRWSTASPRSPRASSSARAWSRHQMGPLVSEEQLQRVTGFLESGREDGATTITGGGRFGDHGYFVEPTVITNTRPDMKIVREEIFGPVVVAAPFRSLDEIAAEANNTSTASGPGSGPGTSPRPTPWPRSSAPEPSGSTATTSSTRPCRSAGTSSPAGAARWATRCSRPTPRSRRSPPSYE